MVGKQHFQLQQIGAKSHYVDYREVDPEPAEVSGQAPAELNAFWVRSRKAVGNCN